MRQILETERLILREFMLTDAKSLYDLNSDPDVIRYTGDPPFASVDKARTFLESYDDYKRYGMGRWAVLLKISDEFLGWCGLKMHPGEYVDLGYRFFQKEWGNGYATESARACLEYGFNYLKLDKIVARVAEENIASVRVLEKLNMTFWKVDTCKGIANAKYYIIKNNY